MAKEDKINMYLVGLVGLVGFVAVVILFMNVAGFSSDVTGEAYSADTVKLSSSGMMMWDSDDCHECMSNLGEMVCGDAVCSTE